MRLQDLPGAIALFLLLGLPALFLISLPFLIIYSLFFTEEGKKSREDLKKWKETQKHLETEAEKTRRIEQIDGKYFSVADKQLRHVRHKKNNRYGAVLGCSHYGTHYHVQPLLKDGTVSTSKPYWSQVKYWETLGAIMIPVADKKATSREIKNTT